MSKKSYTVRLWYTWYKDIDVEAENSEEAEEIANETSWEKIVEDFDTDDLEYDTTEIFGGQE